MALNFNYDRHRIRDSSGNVQRSHPTRKAAPPPAPLRWPQCLVRRIPVTIANLITMLHALDLSFNQLSGPIPAELQGLCDLDRTSLQMNYNSGFMPNDLSDNTPFVDSQNCP